MKRYVLCFGSELWVINFSFSGCNPKTKNNEGNVPKVIAKEEGNKEALKECKKVEKSFGKSGKNNEPWRLELYDFCFERQQMLTDMFKKFDADNNGTIPKEDFIEGLQNMGAPLPSEERDVKTLVSDHDKNRDGCIDYNDFLGGKKYVNKQYLMSAFDGKKKKKKKGGKGKKGKKCKIAINVSTNKKAMDERMHDGGPSEMFFQRHIHYTDSQRFVVVNFCNLWRNV